MIADAQKETPPPVQSPPESEEGRLDEGLEESFPASDPPATSVPQPYWSPAGRAPANGNASVSCVETAAPEVSNRCTGQCSAISSSRAR